MKRRAPAAIILFGVGVVFTALSATGRPALLPVGIAFYIIGMVLLFAGRQSGVK